MGKKAEAFKRSEFKIGDMLVNTDIRRLVKIDRKHYCPVEEEIIYTSVCVFSSLKTDYGLLFEDNDRTLKNPNMRLATDIEKVLYA